MTTTVGQENVIPYDQNALQLGQKKEGKAVNRQLSIMKLKRTLEKHNPFSLGKLHIKKVNNAISKQQDNVTVSKSETDPPSKEAPRLKSDFFEFKNFKGKETDQKKNKPKPLNEQQQVKQTFNEKKNAPDFTELKAFKQNAKEIKSRADDLTKSGLNEKSKKEQQGDKMLTRLNSDVFELNNFKRQETDQKKNKPKPLNEQQQVKQALNEKKNAPDFTELKAFKQNAKEIKSQADDLTKSGLNEKSKKEQQGDKMLTRLNSDVFEFNNFKRQETDQKKNKPKPLNEQQQVKQALNEKKNAPDFTEFKAFKQNAKEIKSQANDQSKTGLNEKSKKEQQGDKVLTRLNSDVFEFNNFKRQDSDQKKNKTKPLPPHDVPLKKYKDDKRQSDFFEFKKYKRHQSYQKVLTDSPSNTALKDKNRRSDYMEFKLGQNNPYAVNKTKPKQLPPLPEPKEMEVKDLKVQEVHSNTAKSSPPAPLNENLPPRVNPPTPRVNPSTPKVNTPAPKVNPPAPRVNPPTPRADLPTARIDPPTPKVDPPTLKVNPPAPRVNPPTPKVNSPTPRVNTLTPKVDPPAPRINPPTTKVNPLAPRVNPPAPRANPPTPKVNPPAPRVNPPTPRVNPPTPRVNPPAPRVNPPTPKLNPPAPRVGPQTPKVNPSAPRVNPLTPKISPPALRVNPPSPKVNHPSLRVNVPPPKRHPPYQRVYWGPSPTPRGNQRPLTPPRINQPPPSKGKIAVKVQKNTKQQTNPIVSSWGRRQVRTACSSVPTLRPLYWPTEKKASQNPYCGKCIREQFRKSMINCCDWHCYCQRN